MIARNAVRALLLTPAAEILLLCIARPEDGQRFWITPCGGLEPGESAEAGLRRELREELGLAQFEFGPLVWRRHHTFNWAGKRVSQHERLFVVHVDRFEPELDDALEMSHVLRTHTLSEMRGFAKALIGADDRILGFTAFGAEASEMMNVVQTAMIGSLPCTALGAAIFTHPTAAEGLIGMFSTPPAEPGKA